MHDDITYRHITCNDIVGRETDCGNTDWLGIECRDIALGTGLVRNRLNLPYVASDTGGNGSTCRDITFVTLQSWLTLLANNTNP